MSRFSRSFQLPDYLEDALAPFSWSGILSKSFRDDIVACLMATEREAVTEEFINTLRLVKFLDHEWVETLASAMTQFAQEGFMQALRKWPSKNRKKLR